MQYLLDPRTGQIRGTCEIGYAFDGEFDDESYENEYYIWRYSSFNETPTLPRDVRQLYVEFANTALPPVVPLLERDWIPFSEFQNFQLLPEEDSFYDPSPMVETEQMGPLFGIYDEESDLISPTEIREPLTSWFDAAKTLNLAIRIQAYLAGRSDGRDLNDALYFMLHTGRGDWPYWECVSYYPALLASPYKEMLQPVENESQRILLPVCEADLADMTILPCWGQSLPMRGNYSPLSLKLIPQGMPDTTVPVAYASIGYMLDHTETKPVAHVLLAHLLRTLVLLHTRRIYHDFHDGFYGVAFNNLLERFWHSFASDAAMGILGVCEHCGCVFEAMSERKDVKRYCSTACQSNAKSARQYRRRKIRELAEELGRRPTLEEAQNAAIGKEVTEEMIDAALKKYGLSLPARVHPFPH